MKGRNLFEEHIHSTRILSGFYSVVGARVDVMSRINTLQILRGLCNSQTRSFHGVKICSVAQKVKVLQELPFSHNKHHIGKIIMSTI
jgi:hypothetical protein